MDGYHLIHGGDWLKSSSLIELDYDQMTFTVKLGDERVKLQALTTMPECKMINGHSAC